MIIGQDFNSRAKELLKAMYEKSEGNADLRLDVKDICEMLNIDKTEIKNLLEYLESKDCINIETMGGPYLYGDISLTRKGVAKSQK